MANPPKKSDKKIGVSKMKTSKQVSKLTWKKMKIPIIAILCLCFAVLGSTYAWFISADSKENNFQGTQLLAEIDEVFTPPKSWQPNQEVTKVIRVRNTGKTPALVRVSLYEFFLSFQVEQQNTGNLKTVEQPIQPAVNEVNTDTWQKAADKGGTYDRDGKYNVANLAIVPDPAKGIGSYEYGSTTHPTTPLDSIDLNFSDAVETTLPAAGISDYWLYEDGYFYYSEVLQPGEESEPLLNGIDLAATMPNQYKGALYKLKVYMDAHDQTATLLEEWKVQSGGSVEQMLKGELS